MTAPAKPRITTRRARRLPARSRGILSDFRHFLLRKPAVATLVDSRSDAGREKYRRRIEQRLAVSVEDYAILNIHRIGIEAPVDFVFEKLLAWSEVPLCWPGHIARLERVEESPEHIHIFLFGRKKRFLGLKNKFFGLNVVPLFKMDAIKIQQVPGPAEFDHAQYLLYECRGGYPIGIFCVYARSPIAGEGETEEAQVFVVVGFNFYGRKDWPDTHIINRVWELIHNRVTANILNRLKQLCEVRIQEGLAEP